MNRQLLHALAVCGVILFCALVWAGSSTPFYTPPVRAMHGPTLLANQPGSFAAPLKRLGVVLELDGCEYDVLGWAGDETLYYRQRCDGTLHRYDPARRSVQIVAALPAGLGGAVIAERDILNRVRAAGVRPASVEPYVRELVVEDSGGLVSPDGAYIAFTTRQVYSYQDVVVILAK